MYSKANPLAPTDRISAIRIALFDKPPEPEHLDRPYYAYSGQRYVGGGGIIEIRELDYAYSPHVSAGQELLRTAPDDMLAELYNVNPLQFGMRVQHLQKMETMLDYIELAIMPSKPVDPSLG